MAERYSPSPSISKSKDREYPKGIKACRASASGKQDKPTVF
jgi:hypothetical protein